MIFQRGSSRRRGGGMGGCSHVSVTQTLTGGRRSSNASMTVSTHQEVDVSRLWLYSNRWSRFPFLAGVWELKLFCTCRLITSLKPHLFLSFSDCRQKNLESRFRSTSWPAFTLYLSLQFHNDSACPVLFLSCRGFLLPHKSLTNFRLQQKLSAALSSRSDWQAGFASGMEELKWLESEGRIKPPLEGSRTLLSLLCFSVGEINTEPVQTQTVRLHPQPGSAALTPFKWDSGGEKEGKLTWRSRTSYNKTC